MSDLSTTLTELGDSYTRIAADVARSGGRPELLQQALIGVFAERVRLGGALPVADIGCGPGWHTARLRDLGLDAFGIDLAPGMVEVARRTYPGLRFEVGSMLELDLPDGSLGGILASYSIIHVPHELRAQAFAELFRVLAAGGALMVIFQVGDERLHRTEVFGQPVSIFAYRLQPEQVAGLLRDAGFEVWMQAVREREEVEKVPQAYLIARKPDAPASS